MRFEHLTSREFHEAIGTCGRLAVVPVGVLEVHASHLPLGQDMLAAH